jgi:hypothetical protein
MELAHRLNRIVPVAVENSIFIRILIRAGINVLIGTVLGIIGPDVGRAF